MLSSLAGAQFIFELFVKHFELVGFYVVNIWQGCSQDIADYFSLPEAVVPASRQHSVLEDPGKHACRGTLVQLAWKASLPFIDNEAGV